MVHFGRRTRYSRLFYILTSFEQKKNRKSIQGQVKKVKKGQIFKIYFFENKDVFLKAESPQQSNGTISFPVSGL